MCACVLEAPRPRAVSLELCRGARGEMMVRALMLAALACLAGPGSAMVMRPVLRRTLLSRLAAATSLAVTAPAFADYGDSAQQKLPAFVPSPIRPTGEMAKTCEIVALGREAA